MPLQRRIFGPLLLGHAVDPRHELVGIDIAIEAHGDRLHVLVVVVLEPVIVVMMVMPVIVVVVVDLEELRLDVENAVEIEGAPLQHIGDLDVAFGRPVQGRVGVDGADARFHLPQLGGRDEIALVEDDDVGEGDLALGLGRVAQAGGEPFGVGDGDDRVQARRLLDVLVDEEGLRDGRGVCQAGGLDDDRVEAALALHQALDDADEVAAHGAADAAVVHLEHFLVRADDELVVDADLAEFVDDDGVALAVRLAQDAVEEGGLAGAEIAGEDGRRGSSGRWRRAWRARLGSPKREGEGSAFI